MKFSIRDFCSKLDQIRKKLRISSHWLEKSLIENFIFRAAFVLKLIQKELWTEMERRTVKSIWKKHFLTFNFNEWFFCFSRFLLKICPNFYTYKDVYFNFMLFITLYSGRVFWEFLLYGKWEVVVFLLSS